MTFTPVGESVINLESLGVPAERLVELVGDAFGKPCLISVTGSLAAGYGNDESDIDVYAVVDGPVLQVPVVAYELGRRVDVRYFSRIEVDSWPVRLRAGQPTIDQCGPDFYKKTRAMLQAAVRFGVGRTLSASDEMAAWLDDLRKGSLTQVVASWWAVEARRRMLAEEWLAGRAGWERRWLRASEMGLAALECRAARNGHPFFGAKWLAEKFRHMCDESSSALVRRCLGWGPAEHTAEFVRTCRDLVRCEEGFDEAAHRWVLSPATGVEVRGYLNRHVVTRWNLRGVEIPPPLSEVLDRPSGRVWSGLWREAPDPTLISLFEADMLWLSAIPET